MRFELLSERLASRKRTGSFFSQYGTALGFASLGQAKDVAEGFFYPNQYFEHCLLGSGVVRYPNVNGALPFTQKISIPNLPASENSG